MGFLTDFIILSTVPSVALLLTKKFPMKLRIVLVINMGYYRSFYAKHGSI
ncbi:hypothetical protein [Bacillus toyonensis]|nr:hypothetical protein [Bacillus toyonensis]